MIGVKIHGRLGNQLFQYAFINAAAAQLGTSFYLDESADSFKPSKYFYIAEKRSTIIRRFIFNLKGIRSISQRIKTKFFQGLKYKNNLTTLIVDDKDTPESQLLKIKDHLLYEGFFQSEKYFETQQNAIKKLFTIKPKYVQLFKQKTELLGKGETLVTVHVRRGDYLNANWQLPSSYYHQAIAKIQQPNLFYVFITDDHDFVAKEFADIEPKHISTANEIIDFQFLVNADINILSNSSFSWWGAYLNPKKAETIAPALWLGKSEVYPKGILCSSWQLI